MFHIWLQTKSRPRRISPTDIAIEHVRNGTDTAGIEARNVSEIIGKNELINIDVLQINAKSI